VIGGSDRRMWMDFSRKKEKLNNSLGKILKQRRVMVPLTLQELAHASGVSASHLGRVERGERFPSGSVLRKIAKPLGFKEDELFTLAGYLSPQSSAVLGEKPEYISGNLDPYVAMVLAHEPADVQRVVISILAILKNIARSSAPEKPGTPEGG